MKELIDRIRSEARVLPGGILKVDSFLNHQVDMRLMQSIGAHFAALFRAQSPDKILTIESSGIAPAGMTALALNIPLIIMKKQAGATTDAALLSTRVHSFTKNNDYELIMSRRYLEPGQRALFIDDFLAMGEAAQGVARIVAQASAQLVGVGIVIEKAFQGGRERLNALRVPVRSLARISKMSGAALEFIE